MAVNGGPGAVAILTHAGVANGVIDQENVNRLMDGAQQIEAATANVNDTNAIDAVRTLLETMAMVLRALVKLIVDFTGHSGNFETMVENGYWHCK